MLSSERGMKASLMGLAFILASATAHEEPKHSFAERAQRHEQGQYLATIAGCLSCHTDSENNGKPLAGGKRFETPFGTFISPNISSSKTYGVGNWSYLEFFNAMKHGRAPNNDALYPVFPYTAFSSMSEIDIKSIWQYLSGSSPVELFAGSHTTRWFVSRTSMSLWQRLYYEPSHASSSRGEYLAHSILHCGECHSPRNFFGAVDRERLFEGGELPDGNFAPPITADALKQWSGDELKLYLTLGENPEGDYAGGQMVEVIENMTAELTEQDLDALVAYILGNTKEYTMNIVLITGANRGLGLEFCRQYLEQGWHVIATCRQPEKAGALIELSEHASLELYALDINDMTSIDDLAWKLAGNTLDLLINNAGVYGGSPQQLSNCELEPWLSTLHTNCVAPAFLTRALLPLLQGESLSKVVFLTSKMGSMADNTSGGSYIYRSSKAALNAVIKSLAIDLEVMNIAVVALHPGWVRTDMGGANGLIDAPESIHGLRQVIESVNVSSSGCFKDYQGNDIPW